MSLGIKNRQLQQLQQNKKDKINNDNYIAEQ